MRQYGKTETEQLGDPSCRHHWSSIFRNEEEPRKGKARRDIRCGDYMASGPGRVNYAPKLGGRSQVTLLAYSAAGFETETVTVHYMWGRLIEEASLQ